MPIYEYSCHGCGKKFEVRQKFADEPLTTHPDCGGEVERLISAPSLHFKGTGWYVTDYAKSGASPSTTGSNGHSESKSESSTNESSSSETKSDSKAETKSDSKPAAAAPAPAPAKD